MSKAALALLLKKEVGKSAAQVLEGCYRFHTAGPQILLVPTAGYLPWQATALAPSAGLRICQPPARASKLPKWLQGRYPSAGCRVALAHLRRYYS